MEGIKHGWTIEVERGPEWLFIRPVFESDCQLVGNELAERIWELLEKHFTYRVVLDLQSVPVVQSALLGQIVILHKRTHQAGGVLRICGLTDTARGVLATSNLDRLFPNFPDRETAVMGSSVRKPR